ncbi:MAG: hypothetical protein R2789_08890 [Microthrixaceae bacterium]
MVSSSAASVSDLEPTTSTTMSLLVSTSFWSKPHMGNSIGIVSSQTTSW